MINTRNFKSIGSIEIPGRIKNLINNKFIIYDWSQLFLGKLEIPVDRHKKLDDQFICKNNPLKPHLYLNPYFLPCKNSACLECIYNDFNIFRSSFQCNFKTCNEKHELTSQLEKNTIMEDNLKVIANLVLANADELIQCNGM